MALRQVLTDGKRDLSGPAEDPLDRLSAAPGSVRELALNDRHMAARPAALTTT